MKSELQARLQNGTLGEPGTWISTGLRKGEGVGVRLGDSSWVY